MNKNYNIGRTALIQTIVEMDFELTEIDIHWAYSFLARCDDTELIKIYGLVYNEYYNKKEE